MKTKTHPVRRKIPFSSRSRRAERRCRGCRGGIASAHREGAGLAGRACRVERRLSQARQCLAVAAALGLPNPRRNTVVTVVTVILAVHTRRASGAAHFGFMACIACRSELGRLSVGHCGAVLFRF